MLVLVLGCSSQSGAVGGFKVGRQGLTRAAARRSATSRLQARAPIRCAGAGLDLISSHRARPFARAVFAISRCILLAVTAADRTCTLVRGRQVSPFCNARTTPANMVPMAPILYPSTFTVFCCCSRGATTHAASAIRPARREHHCLLHSAAANDITVYCTIANCHSCRILLNPPRPCCIPGDVEVALLEPSALSATSWLPPRQTDRPFRHTRYQPAHCPAAQVLLSSLCRRTPHLRSHLL